MIILQFVLFFKLIKFKMSNIEEFKIVLGNRGVYKNYKKNNVVLKLKFKSRRAGVVGRDFAKVEQAAQLRHVQHLFVEVVSEELKNQRVCVCV